MRQKKQQHREKRRRTEKRSKTAQTKKQNKEINRSNQNKSPETSKIYSNSQSSICFVVLPRYFSFKTVRF